MSVNALFDDYFKELFETAEVPDSMDRASIQNQINIKFADDESLRDVMLLELDKIHPESTGSQMVTAKDVKDVLTTIMKSHMKSVLAQKEEHEEMIYELQSRSGGGYAKQMISRILTSYKESGVIKRNAYI